MLIYLIGFGKISLGKYSSLGFYNDYLSGGVFHFINIDDAVIFIYAFS